MKGWAIAGFLAMHGALWANQVSFQGKTFEAYVAETGGGRYREFGESKGATLKVKQGEEYNIVIRNPLPVRAAVAVTVDGLNTVDGRRSSPKNARKWILEPYESMTLRGWQTGSDSSRAFVFTNDDRSYADWKERREGRQYTRNLGVIGVAWFWNAKELDYALHPPQPFDDETSFGRGSDRKSERGAMPAAPSAEGRAGTGMGREQVNHVHEVQFNETAGMFRNGDVMKIYYEFAKEPKLPEPFEGEHGDGRFADDMYKVN